MTIVKWKLLILIVIVFADTNYMTIKGGKKINVICVQCAIVSMLNETKKQKRNDSFHVNYHMKYEGKSPSHPELDISLYNSLNLFFFGRIKILKSLIVMAFYNVTLILFYAIFSPNTPRKLRTWNKWKLRVSCKSVKPIGNTIKRIPKASIEIVFWTRNFVPLLLLLCCCYFFWLVLNAIWQQWMCCELLPAHDYSYNNDQRNPKTIRDDWTFTFLFVDVAWLCVYVAHFVDVCLLHRCRLSTLFAMPHNISFALRITRLNSKITI